jgi:hypothetical protein
MPMSSESFYVENKEYGLSQRPEHDKQTHSIKQSQSRRPYLNINSNFSDFFINNISMNIAIDRIRKIFERSTPRIKKYIQNGMHNH